MLGYALIGLFLQLTLAAQPIATPIPWRRYAVPARLVRIDRRRRLNLFCIGKGFPTVLFDAGTGGGARDWRLVQAAVARDTTACSYDRAGYGFSDPSNQPSDALNAVRDLHRLVVAAHLAKPLVLVGHSNGAIYSVLYAQAFRPDVAGLVLVDPGFTGQQDFDRYGLGVGKSALLRAANAKLIDFARNCLSLAERGWLFRSAYRFSKCLDNPPKPDPALHAALNRLEARPAFFRAYLSEFSSTFVTRNGRSTNDEQVPISSGLLGRIPLLVLTASRHRAPVSQFSSKDQALYYAYWRKGHRRLAALSTIGRSFVVPRTGHFIQNEEPQSIIDAVRETLVAAKARLSHARGTR